jgi:hypothetical protein
MATRLTYKSKYVKANRSRVSASNIQPLSIYIERNILSTQTFIALSPFHSLVLENTCNCEARTVLAGKYKNNF